MAKAQAAEGKPIVIRRQKKVHGGHHGGAWKIAYADFVTAMMAFFLLMWLLGSTTKGDLQGIAEYFRTPLKVALFGGSGSGDSSSVIKGGGKDLTRQHGQVRDGEIEPPKKTINLQAAKDELKRRERAALEDLRARLDRVIEASPMLRGFRNQIRVDITSEGLRVQIVDEQNRPMFDLGSARLKDYTREILRSLAPVLNEVENRIALSGHTDAAPYASGERGYSNWELSADRANASRRELIAGGLDERKIVRVVGLAASVPLVREDPLHPTNRRISIVVLTREAEQAMLAGREATEAPAQTKEDSR
ncbi:MAG: flagellar motor protein MotB [Burkholderiales bacterium]|nr:flagellar motor protein MotB [Burkholderiales bacterium]